MMSYEELSKKVGLVNKHNHETINQAYYTYIGTNYIENQKLHIDYYIKKYKKYADLRIRPYDFDISDETLDKITKYFNGYLRKNNNIFLKNNTHEYVLSSCNNEIIATIKTEDLYEIILNINVLISEESTCPTYKQNNYCCCNQCNYVKGASCRIIFTKKLLKKDPIIWQDLWRTQLNILCSNPT